MDGSHSCNIWHVMAYTLYKTFKEIKKLKRKGKPMKNFISHQESFLTIPQSSLDIYVNVDVR